MLSSFPLLYPLFVSLKIKEKTQCTLERHIVRWKDIYSKEYLIKGIPATFILYVLKGLKLEPDYDNNSE